MLQVTKVKRKDGAIVLHAEESLGEDGPTKHLRLESKEEPVDAFEQAWDGLRAPALKLIEAPTAWRAKTTVAGVTGRVQGDGRFGATVTLLVALDRADAPLVVNTPYLAEEQADGRGGKAIPGDLYRAVTEVLEQAQRYLNGERRQMRLFAAAEA